MQIVKKNINVVHFYTEFNITKHQICSVYRHINIVTGSSYSVSTCKPVCARTGLSIRLLTQGKVWTTITVGPRIHFSSLNITETVHAPLQKFEITRFSHTYKKEEHTTSCSSKRCSSLIFIWLGGFFKINSWLGKCKDHHIKKIKLLSKKFEILYSCGKLCLYNNKTKGFPHKLSFWTEYADMIIGKGVPFLPKAG